MVTKYGMSENGSVEYGENQEVFFGRSVTNSISVEEVAQKIDKEIRKLVDEGYNKAKEILTEKIDDLHKIAKALITYETLTGQEIEDIINKNIYPKDKALESSEDKDDQNSLWSIGLKTKNSSLKYMSKYYTRACNFYFEHYQKKVKKKLSIPIHGNNLISFDSIEIISRKNSKRINIKEIGPLKGLIKKKFF